MGTTTMAGKLVGVNVAEDVIAGVPVQSGLDPAWDRAAASWLPDAVSRVDAEKEGPLGAGGIRPSRS